jgi:hypothetical protein
MGRAALRFYIRWVELVVGVAVLPQKGVKDRSANPKVRCLLLSEWWKLYDLRGSLVSGLQSECRCKCSWTDDVAATLNWQEAEFVGLEKGVGWLFSSAQTVLLVSWSRSASCAGYGRR